MAATCPDILLPTGGRDCPNWSDSLTRPPREMVAQLDKASPRTTHVPFLDHPSPGTLICDGIKGMGVKLSIDSADADLSGRKSDQLYVSMLFIKVH